MESIHLGLQLPLACPDEFMFSTLSYLTCFFTGAKFSRIWWKGQCMKASVLYMTAGRLLQYPIVTFIFMTHAKDTTTFPDAIPKYNLTAALCTSCNSISLTHILITDNLVKPVSLKRMCLE